jgi:hypothetical protein
MTGEITLRGRCCHRRAEGKTWPPCGRHQPGHHPGPEPEGRHRNPAGHPQRVKYLPVKTLDEFLDIVFPPEAVAQTRQGKRQTESGSFRAEPKDAKRTGSRPAWKEAENDPCRLCGLPGRSQRGHAALRLPGPGASWNIFRPSWEDASARLRAGSRNGCAPGPVRPALHRAYRHDTTTATCPTFTT